MQRSSRSIASLLVITLIATLILSDCKKKDDDYSLTTALLAYVLFSASARSFAGACNKFSVNSTCINSFGTFSSTSCTGQGGTVQTSKCSGTNFGACSINSGANQVVYLSGGSSPVCNSTGTCSTDCTGILGNYSSTYTP